jgi:hypothetical protein
MNIYNLICIVEGCNDTLCFLISKVKHFKELIRDTFAHRGVAGHNTTKGKKNPKNSLSSGRLRNTQTFGVLSPCYLSIEDLAYWRFVARHIAAMQPCRSVHI